MSARIRYTNEPLGRLRIVRDFLPLPEDLVLRDEGVKVTIAVSRRSVDFFKGEGAWKHNTQYQRMIRRLLDAMRSITCDVKRAQRGRAPRRRVPVRAPTFGGQQGVGGEW